MAELLIDRPHFAFMDDLTAECDEREAARKKRNDQRHAEYLEKERLAVVDEAFTPCSD